MSDGQPPLFPSILKTKGINKFLNNPFHGLNIIPVNDSRKTMAQNDELFACIRNLTKKKSKPKGVSEKLPSPTWSLTTKLKIFFVIVIHIAILARTLVGFSSSSSSSTPPVPLLIKSMATKKLFVNITSPEESLPSSSGLLTWSLNGTYLRPSAFNSNFNLSIRIFIDEKILNLENDTGTFLFQIPNGKVCILCFRFY